MARQAPECGTTPTSSSANCPAPRAIGMYGSYYKLFRCSDGKVRLDLISEEEYLDSKKRPISVCDVSSTTESSSADVVASCSHRSFTVAASPSNPLLFQPSSASSSLPNVAHSPSAAIGSLLATVQRPQQQQQRSAVSSNGNAAAAANRHRYGNQNHHHCVPQQQHQYQMPRRPLKRQHLAADEARDEEAAHQTIKRQKRDRVVRSTVAVADLIAEYIPPDVVPQHHHHHLLMEQHKTLLSKLIPIQEPIPSSSSTCEFVDGDSANIPPPSSGSAVPVIWNNWIQSVGRRFPMADMSVRQVLDVLDSRLEVTAEE